MGDQGWGAKDVWSLWLCAMRRKKESGIEWEGGQGGQPYLREPRRGWG
jgi:hypothetical protein